MEPLPDGLGRFLSAATSHGHGRSIALPLAAGLDGTWTYDVSAYDNLLLKAILVLLAPFGMTEALLNESTA